MSMTLTQFQCDDAQWQRFLNLCAERDETPGAVLRDLVRMAVQRHHGQSNAPDAGAEADGPPDQLALMRFRILVKAALAEASSWDQMQAALARQGLALVPSGGGVALADLGSGRVLAKGSQVGPGYPDLVRRFRAGLPGHPHPSIAAMVLAEGARR